MEGKVMNMEDVHKSKLPDIFGGNDLEKPEEETPREEVMIEDEKPKQGDMINYTKEIDYGVIDEDGTRISCKSMAEVRILSLLLEMKGGK